MSELAVRTNHENRQHPTLYERAAEKLYEAKYHGAVVDALRRAAKANPEINEALCRQVGALIEAVEFYEAGVEAGEFLPRGKSPGSGGLSQSDLDIDPRRIHEGRKLRDKNAVEFIRAHIDESLALSFLLRSKLGKDSFGSVSDEWYTPHDIIQAAVTVMGEIDLDPASSAEANETVGAETFWTAADSPLERDWFGRVFLNPPFTRSADFVTKLVDEYKVGRAEAAVLVINGNRFDARWFHPLWDHLLCFTYNRPAFRNPLMDYNARPMGGTAIVYFGPRRDLFVAEFSPFGAVVERCGQ